MADKWGDPFKNELVSHVPELRAFARGLARDRTLGDDIVQEALLRAWAKSHTFESGTNMRAWLFTILRNVFYERGRRQSREVEDPDQVIANATPSRPNQESSVALTQLDAAMNRLPVEQREALILVGASGFTYEQAAEIIGCAAGTVKSRVSRAREVLAVELDHHERRGGANARTQGSAALKLEDE
jgi:RNA polymerase sigma-70 factor (ECF subfamily)